MRLSSENDSYDDLNSEFSRNLREMKKTKANHTIFLSVEAYKVITEKFKINSDEYDYFLDKYRDSKKTDIDKTQNELLTYFKAIIERLQKITRKKVEINLLELLSIDIENSIPKPKKLPENSNFPIIQPLKVNKVVKKLPKIDQKPKETYQELQEELKESGIDGSEQEWEEFELEEISEEDYKQKLEEDRLKYKNVMEGEYECDFEVFPLKFLGFDKVIPIFQEKKKD